MKTLYKFCYKISNNPKEWDQELRYIFSLQDSFCLNVVDSYRNIEKTWCETVNKVQKSGLLSKAKTSVGDLIIETIAFGFNRYQEAVYVTLVFDNDISEKRSFIKYKDYITKNLFGFADCFSIPFKETDFYTSEEDEYSQNKYQEFLCLKNPVILDDKPFRKSEKVCQLGSAYMSYKICYGSNKTNYTREYQLEYHLKESSNLEDCIEHYHSIFILFHRSYAHYCELTKWDNYMRTIAKISISLNRIWPKERVKLLLLNRFLHAGLYNKTFYSILELNAQMDSLYTQLLFQSQTLSDKYAKQYERVLHNFGEEWVNTPYIQELLVYLKAPSVHRERMLKRVSDLFEPTNVQIERLRSDNDSKVNFSIQWIMTILSLIVFVYGILTVWYENTIKIDKIVSDVFADTLGIFPIYLITILGFSFVGVMMLVFLLIIKNGSVTSYKIKKMIKTGVLDYTYLSDLNGKINKIKRKKLLFTTEFLKMITTYLIIKSNIEDCEMDKLNEILAEVGK